MRMRTKTLDPSIDLETRGKHTVVKRVHQNSRLCRQVGIIQSCSRFNSPGVDHDRSSCASRSHTLSLQEGSLMKEKRPDMFCLSPELRREVKQYQFLSILQNKTNSSFL